MKGPIKTPEELREWFARDLLRFDSAGKRHLLKLESIEELTLLKNTKAAKENQVIMNHIDMMIDGKIIAEDMVSNAYDEAPISAKALEREEEETNHFQVNPPVSGTFIKQLNNIRTSPIGIYQTNAYLSYKSNNTDVKVQMNNTVYIVLPHPNAQKLKLFAVVDGLMSNRGLNFGVMSFALLLRDGTIKFI